MHPKDRIVVVSGKFDPLNNHELKFLQKCKSKGDWLVVGVHSDWYLAWCDGGFVQNYESRRNIIKGLKTVDEVFSFNDSDGTVCQLLKIIKACYPDANNFDRIIKLKNIDDLNIEYVKLDDNIGYWISENPFMENGFELFKNLGK